MHSYPQTRAATSLDVACQLVYRLGFPVARMCWRLSRTRHEGAVVAIYVDQSLLLLRSSYRREWTFPGGGVRSGESPEEAARRELAEEIGLKPDRMSAAGSVRGIWDGRRDHVHLFELRLQHPPELNIDNREVVGARLVPIRELPMMPVTGPVAAYLQQITEQRSAASVPLE